MSPKSPRFICRRQRFGCPLRKADPSIVSDKASLIGRFVGRCHQNRLASSAAGSASAILPRAGGARVFHSFFSAKKGPFRVLFFAEKEGLSEHGERCFLASHREDKKMQQCFALLSKPDSPSRKKDLYGPFRERRRRDLNPRAAINDLHPFQGCPFGQLGYFSECKNAL